MIKNGLIDNQNIINNILSISHQTNKGVAFGIQFGQSAQIILSIVIISLLMIMGFKWFFIKNRNTFLNQILLGIIVGGAIGNLWNRIQLGYVIDFIALKYIPVFNIADIGITLGLIALSLLNIKDIK